MGMARTSASAASTRDGENAALLDQMLQLIDLDVGGKHALAQRIGGREPRFHGRRALMRRSVGCNGECFVHMRRRIHCNVQIVDLKVCVRGTQAFQKVAA